MKVETLTKKLAAIAEGSSVDAIAAVVDVTEHAAAFDAVALDVKARGDVLRASLTESAPLIAAHVAAGRGRQAELARAVAEATGASQNTATKRVGRIALVGRLMVAHPNSDPLALYTFVNGASKEQVEAAIVSGGDPVKAPKRERGAGKETGTEKKAKAPKTVREQVIAASGTLKALTDRAIEEGTRDDQAAYLKMLQANVKRIEAALASGVNGESIAS